MCSCGQVTGVFTNMKVFYLLTFYLMNDLHTKYQVTDGANAYWTVLTTSNYYADFRMKTISNFRQCYIPKDTPKIWARMDCAKMCSADKTCLAFSFYEKENYFACDLAGDNYCVNGTSKALILQNGSFVWDKIVLNRTTVCFQPAPIPCENVRPGCNGPYPNCTQCIQTCIDCEKRYTYTGYRTCMLWPDGAGPDSDPITVECDDEKVILIGRKMNLTTGIVYLDNRLSFEDMWRLHRLNTYTYVRFIFLVKSGATYSSRCKVAAIESNGTLRNITFYAGYNILNLSSSIPTTLHFVTVTNDTYGCGSFWLLDPKNATYCPGGPVRMFGTPIVNGTNVISTGFRFGNELPSYTFVGAGMYLTIA